MSPRASFTAAWGLLQVTVRAPTLAEQSSTARLMAGPPGGAAGPSGPGEAGLLRSVQASGAAVATTAPTAPRGRYQRNGLAMWAPLEKVGAPARAGARVVTRGGGRSVRKGRRRAMRPPPHMCGGG